MSIDHHVSVTPNQELRLRVIDAVAGAAFWLFDPPRDEGEKDGTATASLNQLRALIIEYFPGLFQCNLEVVSQMVLAVIIAFTFMPTAAFRVLRNFAARRTVDVRDVCALSPEYIVLFLHGAPIFVDEGARIRRN